jgi:hypothetical protein
VDAQTNPYLSPGQPEAPAPAAAVPDSIWIPRVASGLGTIAVGTVLMLSASVARSTLRSQFPISTFRLHQAAFFMFAAAWVWNAFGLVSCTATPNAIAGSRGLRWSIVIAFLLAGLNVGRLATLDSEHPEDFVWLAYFYTLALTAFFVTLGLYLGELARFVHQLALGRLARIAMASILVWGIADFIYFVFILNDPALRGAAVTGAIGLSIHVCYWVALALYIGLTVRTRSKILQRLEYSPIASEPIQTEIDSSVTIWLKSASISRTRVLMGLALCWLGIAVLLVAVAIPVVPWIEPALGWPSDGVFLALRVTLVVSVALKLAGALSCLVTPDESAARAPVQIASAAALFALFVRTSALLAERGILPPIEFPVGAVASLLEAAWAVAFLVYLQRLTRFIGRPDLLRWFFLVLVGVISLTVIDMPFGLHLVGVPRSSFVYYSVATVHALRFYGEFLVYILYTIQIWRIRAAIVRCAE